MVVQNNSTPWVVLAVFVMVGCAVGGLILGNAGPFNAEIVAAKVQITQTQAAINAHATQAAMDSVQTQQAPMVQQTVVVAQMTAVPLQQTATFVAGSDDLQLAQLNATQTAISADSQNAQMMAQATQTAIADDLYIQSISRNATATAITREQVQDNVAGIAKYAVFGFGAFVLCGWIVLRSFVQFTNSRAKEKEAHAQLLAEQRRLASLRASIQAQQRNQRQQYPIPTSLMKRPGNGKDLPRAE